MQKFAIFVVALLGSLVSGALLADTLELADGTLLEGDFVGSSNGIVMFNTGDGIEAFPGGNPGSGEPKQRNHSGRHPPGYPHD
jgi:hypothetical protein